MNFKGRKRVIACQCLIILVCFAAIPVSYYTMDPFINDGETYRMMVALDAYKERFCSDNGCNPHDREQLEKALVLTADPFKKGELYLADSSGKLFYSWDGTEGDISDCLEKRYGKIAVDLLSEEYISPSGRIRNRKMNYDESSHFSFYANYSEEDNMMFFYAVDYFIAGDKLIRRFLYLRIFMILTGLCVLVTSYFIGRRFIVQGRSESLVQQELDTAAMLQKSMLPREEKHMMHMDVNARLIPARKVGGDFYYYLLRKGILYFCIGDVSGKGIPAAIFMSKAVTLFRSHANAIKPPLAIATSMNEELCINNDSNMFLTAVIGAMNVMDGSTTFVNAGHMPPIVWDGKEESGLEVLKTKKNIPLGLMPEAEFVEESFELCRNGLMLFYTDGVSEARSKDGRYLKFSSIIKKFSPYRTLNAKKINDNLLRLVSEFEAGAEQSDDITLLTFRNSKKPSTLTIKNEISELGKIGPFVERILNETPLERSDRVRLRSGLDEAMTNCVMYAYDSPGNDIEVTASIENRRLHFVVTDAGKPFNPLEHRAEAPDELRPGGLGIAMMRTIFDDVQYERKEEKNILKLIKNLQYENPVQDY